MCRLCISTKPISLVHAINNTLTQIGKLLTLPLCLFVTIWLQVVNFMSTDTDRIVNFCQTFHEFWSLPFQVAVSLYLLHQQVQAIVTPIRYYIFRPIILNISVCRLASSVWLMWICKEKTYILIYGYNFKLNRVHVNQLYTLLESVTGTWAAGCEYIPTKLI